MSVSDNIKRGTIDVLVLTLLKQGDMYGYQISQELDQQSRGLYTLQETSLYPTLYRLEDKGMIESRRELVGRRRTRVYYHITEKGVEYLQRIRRDYLSLNRGVLYILGIDQMETLEKEIRRK